MPFAKSPTQELAHAAVSQITLAIRTRVADPSASPARIVQLVSRAIKCVASTHAQAPARQTPIVK